MSTSADTGNHLLGYYDAGGNMTSDGVNTYVYDGENRVSSVAGVSYTYDADGRRVKKSSGTNYWYGPSGEAMAETDSAGVWTNYVFFGGIRLARNVNGRVAHPFSRLLCPSPYRGCPILCGARFRVCAEQRVGLDCD